MYSIAGASLIHFILAPYLATTLDLKMTGVAISTSIHFVIRFIIQYLCCICDKDLQRSHIPLWHPDSWNGLGEITKIGFNSFLMKVMGWWAFDVFTTLASEIGQNKYTAA